MQVVILAGGRGTRISEESAVRPKPMIEVGGMPLLWHIMKIYSFFGLNDFIICLGYKGYVIKEYFSNYVLHHSDITVDMKQNRIQYHSNNTENWRVTLVETGLDTMTGGRLKRIEPYLNKDEPFCMTYGDGLSDINITDLINFHKKQKKEATVTAVYPSGRFGALKLSDTDVVDFTEKPNTGDESVNGGFFVLEPRVLHRIDGDQSTWEDEPLKTLTKERQLAAYRHNGFWQPVDTLREKEMVCSMWERNDAPWKKWL